ncbi:hypothetical protein OIE66_04135 [Nonomuraea sp. NBC_01738]|uniref:hypothetical protein n=1 Tax=Nonomuraea sp. NBC_01738 TaxID=2976003 RepID=UPI002E11B118|nr:hypothetical protein OIE66_04135 [Nonomuraea sp. NBC_01738]
MSDYYLGQLKSRLKGGAVGLVAIGLVLLVWGPGVVADNSFFMGMTIVVALIIGGVPALTGAWSAFALDTTAERLARARITLDAADMAGTEVEVRNSTRRALVVWGPLVLADVAVALSAGRQAAEGGWLGAGLATALLAVLAYPTAKVLNSTPVIVMNGAGVTFARGGVTLPWKSVKVLRLRRATFPRRLLWGEQTLVVFSTKRSGEPIVVHTASLDLRAEEIVAFAEKYSGLDIRDER